MRQLILTADDFGVNDYIDRGIVGAIEKDRINSVAMMVTHPDQTEKSLSLLAEKNFMEKVGIGLHFSITSGYSLLGRASTLVDQQDDRGWLFHLARKYKFRDVKLRELREELLLQLERLDDLLGEIKIDSVSNHHGFTYIDLDFYQVYIDTIAEYSEQSKKYDRPIPIRSPMSWLKSKVPVYDADGKFSHAHVRRGIQLGMAKKLPEVTKKKLRLRKKWAKELGIAFPDLLADTVYGQPTRENYAALLSQYKNYKMSTEFMFHLGEGPVGDIPHGINEKYMGKRNKEYEALTSLKLEELLKEYEIKMITFKDLS